MGSKDITLDTHVLLWYVDELLKRRLSPLALRAIREAEKEGIIYIPAIVLMEMLHLVERKRSSISFDRLMMSIEESSNYRIVPIDGTLLKAAIPLKGLEIHDRLILATAMLTGSALVTKDREIKARGVNVLW
jgi:PIN domain nuclease of toxin-antitoxin system